MAIHLRKVLEQMEMVNSKREPQPFDIEFYTCSLVNRTGGELKRIRKAVLSKMVQGLPRIGRGKPGAKRMNEFANMHRNLFDVQAEIGGRMMVKVHIRLIHKFNGDLVEW
jgi:hypothetical protein